MHISAVMTIKINYFKEINLDCAIENPIDGKKSFVKNGDVFKPKCGSDESPIDSAIQCTNGSVLGSNGNSIKKNFCAKGIYLFILYNYLCIVKTYLF